jgi:hypothetical protein
MEGTFNAQNVANTLWAHATTEGRALAGTFKVQNEILSTTRSSQILKASRPAGVRLQSQGAYQAPPSPWST